MGIIIDMLKKKKIYLTSSIIFMIDFLSKLFIKNNFEYGKSIEIIKNFLNITYVENTGGAFSILSKSTYLLIVFGILILIALIQYIEKNNLKKIDSIAISFILGGLIGNLFDRVFYKAVIDFFDFNIFGYNFPIFNISDIFIVCGIILIIFSELGGEKHADR